MPQFPFDSNSELLLLIYNKKKKKFIVGILLQGIA